MIYKTWLVSSRIYKTKSKNFLIKANKPIYKLKRLFRDKKTKIQIEQKQKISSIYTRDKQRGRLVKMARNLARIFKC